MSAGVAPTGPDRRAKARPSDLRVQRPKVRGAPDLRPRCGGLLQEPDPVGLKPAGRAAWNQQRRPGPWATTQRPRGCFVSPGVLELRRSRARKAPFSCRERRARADQGHRLPTTACVVKSPAWEPHHRPVDPKTASARDRKPGRPILRSSGPNGIVATGLPAPGGDGGGTGSRSRRSARRLPATADVGCWSLLPGSTQVRPRVVRPDRLRLAGRTRQLGHG